MAQWNKWCVALSVYHWLSGKWLHLPESSAGILINVISSPFLLTISLFCSKWQSTVPFYSWLSFYISPSIMQNICKTYYHFPVNICLGKSEYITTQQPLIGHLFLTQIYIYFLICSSFFSFPTSVPLTSCIYCKQF